MNFAFLVHPRTLEDIPRRFKIAKYLPKSWIEWWGLHGLPFIGSKITGLKSQTSDGKEDIGWLIGIPMTAKQILKDRERAQKQIIKGINKAERLGAQIIGLGALTSSVTQGGLAIKDKVNICVTTGHGYTTHIVTSTALAAVDFFGLEKKNLKLAIVGAAGSIGTSSAKVMALKGIRDILLIDISRKVDRIDEVLNYLKNNYPEISVKKSHSIDDVKDRDLIITATNTPEALIESHHLKQGAIVVDDAQPSDVSADVLKNRKDVLVLSAGVVNTPGVDNHFNFGLADKEDNFCCLGEVMILAANDWSHKNNIGTTNLDSIFELAEAGEKLGFHLGRFQNFDKAYSKEELSQFARYLHQ